MRRACCDWAAVNLGRPADQLTSARTCPRHLRGVTIHRRPAVPVRTARARRRAWRFVMACQWDRAMAQAGEAIR